MLMTIAPRLWVELDRTFMGIAIHNLSASEEAAEQSDLVAALKGTAAGILGTTVQMADLVCAPHLLIAYVLVYPSTGDSFCCRGVPVYWSCCSLANVRS